jgi:hypothetical protein
MVMKMRGRIERPNAIAYRILVINEKLSCSNFSRGELNAFRANFPKVENLTI